MSPSPSASASASASTPTVAPAPTATSPRPPTALGRVDRKSAAYFHWLQGALNQAIGIRLVVDGVAGPKTVAALRALQARAGLVIDGRPGPQTDKALRELGIPPEIPA